MRGVRVAWALAGLSLGLFFAGLAFRAFLYSRMYLEPGAPYGIADIIEFLLGWALLGSLAMSLVSAAVLGFLGPRQARVAAAWLFAFSAAVAALLVPLHDFAARWSSQ